MLVPTPPRLCRWYHQTQTHYYSRQLRQTWQSCEAGPGAPSSHSSHALVLGHALLADLLQLRPGPATAALFWGLQAAVWLARVFVGAHFPHQCLLGAAVGQI